MSGRLGAFVLRCRDELVEVDENPQEWLSQMSIISMMQDRVLRDDFVLRTNPEGKTTVYYRALFSASVIHTQIRCKPCA